MQLSSWISPLVAPYRQLERLPSGIFRDVDARGFEGSAYDSRAGVYDRLIRSEIYNRLMWGTTPERYEAFAREASVGQGPLLDAGCGSMACTASAMKRSNRVVVGVDLSEGMLRQAQSRLGVSPLVALVQADAFRMPFIASSFETVLSMGMLHIFADPKGYIDELKSMASPGGRVYLSCLVRSGRRIGDAYLRALRRAGEIAQPFSVDQVMQMVQRIGRPVFMHQEGNMLFTCAERAPVPQTFIPEIASSSGRNLL